MIEQYLINNVDISEDYRLADLFWASLQAARTREFDPQQASHCLARINSAFEGALRHARTSGELRGDLDPTETAGFLVNTFLGAAVLLRSKSKPAHVIRGVKVALKIFE